MLDLLLGFIFELLPDFLIEYLLGQLFRGIQEPWNWVATRLL
jgi:hypothetical protein